MLASTVQFSRYGRSRWRAHRVLGSEDGQPFGATTVRGETSAQKALVPSGPNSVPTAELVVVAGFRTGYPVVLPGASTGAAELVSVPPMSDHVRSFA